MSRTAATNNHAENSTVIRCEFGRSDDHCDSKYELPDAIDLLIQSGRTIDTIRLDGWRIDVGYPGDRDRAEKRLNDTEGTETEEKEDVADQAVADS